jgi:DNA-binding protein YbaB
MNKGFYVDKAKLKIYIQENVLSSDDFEMLKDVIKASRNWTDFKNRAENEIGGTFISRW